MSTGAFLAGAFIAEVAAFACLALSQKKHWSLFARVPLAKSRQIMFRSISCVLLTVSFVLLCQGSALSFGSLKWICSISVTALLVSQLLTLAAAALKQQHHKPNFRDTDAPV